jgi:carbon storage regulator CsrA
MLVLSRKPGERIVFPGLGVVLTVLRTDSGRVQIGIEAPAAIPVHREEVRQRLMQSPAVAEAGRSPVPSKSP